MHAKHFTIPKHAVPTIIQEYLYSKDERHTLYSLRRTLYDVQCKIVSIFWID